MRIHSGYSRKHTCSDHQRAGNDATGEAGFDLWGVAVLVIIGVALIVLAPAKQSGERVSAAVA